MADQVVRAAIGEARDFMDRVIRSNTDDCILWPYSRDKDGYGRISQNGRPVRVHLLVCEAIHGLRSVGQEVAHSCHKGHLGCINPRHLSWRSHAENVADREAEGRGLGGRRGNGLSSLTTQDVADMRALASSMSQERIAKIFGVSQVTVSRLLRGLRMTAIEARAA